ncbi:MAG: hypothetical protein R3352_06980 [Salinisphaeraceae bacterium]|nr:hypothetical protein [Salinisphaeraceae bacterium]
MNTRSRFLLLNIVGGVAVLGSYVWGIGLFPELRDAFWGGVPESLRGIYTINMFFAAAGYIGAFTFFMLKVSDNNYQRLALPYILILLPSALWLPLTVAVLQHPSEWLWWLIRIDLFAVGLGGLLLYPAIWQTPASSAFKAAVMFGLLFFCLQTAVLDALIWPYYFELPAAR